MKFLVVGFSGIEMPSGFVPIAQELITRRIPGATLERVGIGGISHDHLAHFLDRILDRHLDADYIIYCIANTNYREARLDALAESSGGTELAWDEIEYLARASQGRGMRTGFLNFPRDQGYDYTTDKFEKIISDVCTRSGLGYRSISRELQEKNFDLSSILMDASHPNESGAKLYAELFVDFAEQLMSESTIRATPLEGPFRRSFHSRRIIEMVDIDESRVRKFSRYGFEETGYILRAGETMLVDLGETRYISGFSVLAGPKSGQLCAVGDGEVISEAMIYDQHCYYERVLCWNFPSRPVRRIELYQDSIIPDIALLKGEKDEGTREVTLFHVFETKYGQ